MSRLICGENLSYSLDCFETQISNNVLVFGATGSGKSRSFICPNIEQLYGSILVYDPKGALYRRYASWLREQGYYVAKLDFSNVAESIHYNPFAYIHTTQDVASVAHALVSADGGYRVDPFWDEASRLLLQSLIAYLIASRPKRQQNMSMVMSLIEAMCQGGDMEENTTRLDQMFAGMRNAESDMGQYALRCYRQFRVSADKTLRSIVISTCARLVPFTAKEIEELTAVNDLDITMLGKRKTALFAVCSDCETHLERVVRLFFTQALHELCRYADQCCVDQKLPVPVRLILDDFACGVSLQDFPKSIAIMRSRGISAIIVLQSISQLSDLYGPSGAKTIIANSDTMIYMGTNDVETATEISARTDLPLKKILYMPIGYSWVFRRGMQPVYVKNISPAVASQPLSISEQNRRLTEEPIRA